MTVETVKDESSLSCRLMWKTAHLQVLLVCMKVCFKISMKLTPVECHDGREVKGKVKLYVIGRVVEQREGSEWKGKLLKHIRSIQRGQVRMCCRGRSTVINPLEQNKRERKWSRTDIMKRYIIWRKADDIHRKKRVERLNPSITLKQFRN